MSPGTSAAPPVLSCHLLIFFNKPRESNLCSGNMIPGLRLEERVRERGEIPLLQNSALITICPLHDFHPCGQHGLQTTAMGEASKKITSKWEALVRAAPTLMAVMSEQAAHPSVHLSVHPSIHPSILAVTISVFGNSLLLAQPFREGTMEKQQAANREYFLFYIILGESPSALDTTAGPSCQQLSGTQMWHREA